MYNAFWAFSSARWQKNIAGGYRSVETRDPAVPGSIVPAETIQLNHMSLEKILNYSVEPYYYYNKCQFYVCHGRNRSQLKNI